MICKSPLVFRVYKNGKRHAKFNHNHVRAVDMLMTRLRKEGHDTFCRIYNKFTKVETPWI